MTVKETKNKKKFPWFLVWIVLGVSIVITVFYLINLGFRNRSIAHEETRKIRHKNYIKKVNDIIIKKYDIVCNNNIIKKDNYQVIKVKGDYRVMVGSDIKDLEKTFDIGKCAIIYVITNEVK